MLVTWASTLIVLGCGWELKRSSATRAAPKGVKPQIPLLTPPSSLLHIDETSLPPEAGEGGGGRGVMIGVFFFTDGVLRLACASQILVIPRTRLSSCRGRIH